MTIAGFSNGGLIATGGTSSFAGSTTIDSSGNINVGSGHSLVLNNSTSSYTPANLNYYETLATSGSTSGCVSTTASYSLTRIGNIVTYFLKTEITSGSGANSALTLPTIPTRFTPGTGVNIPYFFKDNGTWVTGILQINTNSTVFVLRDGSGTPPTGGAVDFPTCCFTWSLT